MPFNPGDAKLLPLDSVKSSTQPAHPPGQGSAFLIEARVEFLETALLLWAR